MAMNYEDITAGAMGKLAGEFSPTFWQNSWNTALGVGQRELDRSNLTKEYTAGNITRGMQRTQAERALAGSYNQRGMLDSGQYQYGGNVLKDVFDQLQGRAFDKYTSAIDMSLLQDEMAGDQLGQLKDLLTSGQYQEAVANMINRAGGMA